MHWSRKSESSLVNALALDLTAMVEEALETGALTRPSLVDALGVSNSRISQILSAPGNLTLRTMVRLAKACGKDITIVPYEALDEDSGPIHPEVFYATWAASGKPKMMWQVAPQPQTLVERMPDKWFVGECQTVHKWWEEQAPAAMMSNARAEVGFDGLPAASGATVCGPDLEGLTKTMPAFGGV